MGKNTKPSMNPFLRDFWQTPSRGKVLYGGRMSSKSWDAAANLLRVIQTVNVRVLCTRMFQNKLDESVYSLIKSQVERFGLSHKFEFQKSKIKCIATGSEVFFYGLARNIEEIKSLENITIMWMEEAHAITEDMWKIIEPTIIRNEGSEIWVIFNPKFATDFAYKRFVVNPPDGYLVRQINYDQNPFLGKSALHGINVAKGEDYSSYEHVYLGVPLDDSDRVIIKRKWLMASIDAHKKLGVEPTGQNRIGYDVADDGIDLCATVSAYGILTTGCEEWKAGKDELVSSAYRVANMAVKDRAEVYYDAIGVGASTGSNIKQYNALNSARVEFIGWNASGGKVNPDNEYKDGILNKDQFSNAKSQSWWVVADRLIETYNAVVENKPFDPNNIISVSSELPNMGRLFDELSAPYRDMDATGKAKVESKKDMIKRGIKSPNMADAFIMAYAPQERRAHNWIGAI